MSINKQLIRDLLLIHKDGLTLRQINGYTGIDISNCSGILKRSYGFYISHWTHISSSKKISAQVWKCVPVPENAPKPKASQTDRDRKAYQAAYRMKMRNKKLDQQIKESGSLYKQERKDKKQIKAKKIKPVIGSNGLTTIRGPWPT